MKKEEKNKLKDIGDYAGLGIEEMGRDEGIRIDIVQILDWSKPTKGCHRRTTQSSTKLNNEKWCIKCGVVVRRVKQASSRGDSET